MAEKLTLDELERNDEPGAMAYARQEIEAERLTLDELRILLMLQDDPRSLAGKLAALVGERELPQSRP